LVFLSMTPNSSAYVVVSNVASYLKRWTIKPPPRLLQHHPRWSPLLVLVSRRLRRRLYPLLHLRTGL